MELQGRKKLIILGLVLLGSLCFGLGTLWGTHLRQTDQESVATPSESEQAADGEKQQEEELLNLNTADYEALTSLPGIGDSTARKILDFRSEYGGFNELSDLIALDLLTEKQLKDIQEKVTVFFP